MASANNGKKFLDLSVKEFTFAIMGRDTTHFHNEVDDLFDITNFGYKEIASYLKYISEGWDQCILAAIKEDMSLAFDEFMFSCTSVATPIGFKEPIQVKDTVPDHIGWENGVGRVCDMSYDGIDIYCDDEPFDCIPMIDAHRDSIGFSPLKSLEFNQFRRALSRGTHDLFVKFQREHFEKHTLYTYALGLINQHLEEIEENNKSGQPQPDSLHKEVCLSKTILPGKFDTPEAMILFDGLCENGLAQKVGNAYAWLGTNALFGYFVLRSSDKLNIRHDNGRLPWGIYQQGFSMTTEQISTAKNFVSNFKSRKVNEPQGYDVILRLCK
ncbi:MAG: hypothetical protein K2M11_01355 [Paramuribaculum sp.]|nr:hypothetical protein [Paramuribaculum sp.]